MRKNCNSKFYDLSTLECQRPAKTQKSRTTPFFFVKVILQNCNVYKNVAFFKMKIFIIQEVSLWHGFSIIVRTGRCNAVGWNVPGHLQR